MNRLHASPRPWVLASLLTIASVAGCHTGPTIGSESNQEIDLTRFRSYSLLPLEQLAGAPDPGAPLRYAQPVQESVRTSMLRLGYREAEVAEADVVLNVRGQVVPRTEVTHWGYGYGGYDRWGHYYGGYGPDITVHQYNEGTLIIEAFPRDSKTLAWVGWATDQFYERPTEEEVRQAVEQVLAQFPPAAAP